MVFPCTADGFQDAIDEGGGPHTFDCSGPTRVSVDAGFLIDEDVILDGAGDLILDGGDTTRMIEVGAATVELRGIGIENGEDPAVFLPAGATLTLRQCSIVSTNGSAMFVAADSRLTLLESTVAENVANFGAGLRVQEGGIADVVGSTFSNNDGQVACGGIQSEGLLTVSNSTFSGNDGEAICVEGNANVILNHVTISADNEPASTSTVVVAVDSDGASLAVTNSIILGACRLSASGLASGGHNIESPLDSCGLAGLGDLDGIDPANLNLGPLQANGGPTETHEPGEGPTLDGVASQNCNLETDQRGIARPQGVRCDIGAVEVVDR